MAVKYIPDSWNWCTGKLWCVCEFFVLHREEECLTSQCAGLNNYCMHLSESAAFMKCICSWVTHLKRDSVHGFFKLLLPGHSQRHPTARHRTTWAPRSRGDSRSYMPLAALILHPSSLDSWIDRTNRGHWLWRGQLERTSITILSLLFFQVHDCTLLSYRLWLTRHIQKYTSCSVEESGCLVFMQ